MVTLRETVSGFFAVIFSEYSTILIICPILPWGEKDPVKISSQGIMTGMAIKMTLSIKLDPEVKRQLEEIAKQQNTSLNRLVLRYISQGIEVDTGEPDRLVAIEARLDAIEHRLNEVSKQ
jgi:predicted transcriptional regulator